VQVMALPHEAGTIEIGCNLQASVERRSPPTQSVLDYIVSVLPRTASVSQAYVVGLKPNEALERARNQLEHLCDADKVDVK